ncbi:MAG: HD domain-containing protein [Desulfurococcales archaeon]|nr:HD domain-containing protein [Desulfurococcales archaeon]
MGALVGPKLVAAHVEKSPLLSRAWEALTTDREIQSLLRMANINAVERLLYNDHGPVHAAIVSGSALEIFDILYRHGLRPSSIIHRITRSLDCAKLIVLMGAYLHDIGNSIHRKHHELVGAMMAAPILDRLLPAIVEGEDCDPYMIRSEIQHAIYATAMDVEALTLEASVVKVADATDMAEGRARLPYAKGKEDIHALSALSIKKVIIEENRDSRRPLRIKVYMEDMAGMFQIERVLLPKIKTSIIGEYIIVEPVLLGVNARRLKPIFPGNC